MKRNGVCLIIEILFLSDSSVKSFISILSTNMFPLVLSKYLSIKLNSVLLPFPLLPTIAIFLLGSNNKFNPLKV